MRRRATYLLVLAAALAWRAPARAEALAPRQHALLLLRVLAYDRNVAQRAGPSVTVAVLARPGDRASEERAEALHGALEDAARQVVVAGLPVRAVVVPFRDAADLEGRLDALHPALLAVDEALSAEIPELARAARRRHVLTSCTGRPMAEAGLSVAVSAGAARASLLINLAAARAEGADLDAALLAISQVLREEPGPGR